MIDGVTTPWTAPKDYVFSDSGFLRITKGFTVSGTTLTSSGMTKMDFTGTVSSKPSFVGAAVETKYYESKTSTGVTLRIPNTAFTVDATTGYKTSTNNSAEKIEATLYMGLTNYQALLAEFRAGNVVIVTRGIGLKATDSTILGFEHLCGTITEFSAENKEGLFEVKITVTGGVSYTASTGVTFTDYNTCSTGATNKIQPDGVPNVEYTILALTASTTGTSFVTLMTGVILQTAAA